MKSLDELNIVKCESLNWTTLDGLVDIDSDLQ